MQLQEIDMKSSPSLECDKLATDVPAVAETHMGSKLCTYLTLQHAWAGLQLFHFIADIIYTWCLYITEINVIFQKKKKITCLL